MEKISGFGCLFKAIDLKQLKLSPVRIADVMRNETEALKFSIARKILPLLDLLAKFKRMLAYSCSRQIFAVARKLAFLSVLLEIL